MDLPPFVLIMCLGDWMTPGLAEPGEAGDRSEHLEKECMAAAAVEELRSSPPRAQDSLVPRRKTVTQQSRLGPQAEPGRAVPHILLLSMLLSLVRAGVSSSFQLIACDVRF